ncbi:GGDEF domain-containing protein [soil metagenome]
MPLLSLLRHALMEPIAIEPCASTATGSWQTVSSVRDSAQRARVAQSMLAMLVYALFAGLHEFEVWLGLVDPQPAHALALFMLTGGVVFHLFVRSGLNQRCFSHGTLIQAQCLFGVLCATLSYGVNGPTRGAVLLIVLLILVFGMFALQPAEARRIGLASLVMLGAVMAWSGWGKSALREPAVELVHFLFICVGVSTVLLLSQRLGALRSTLIDQKSQLESALGRLRETSIRDDLTGLVNRRHMNARFEFEMVRHERSGESMAVVLLDLDHFKRINDRHGHAVGDRVLKAFAKVATEELRSSDVLARWGGEEFLLLLPMTPKGVATSALERLRLTLQQHPVAVADPQLRVTFSAGVAFRQRGDTVQSLIERADRAMYRAKLQGRDRTLVSDESDEPTTV